MTTQIRQGDILLVRVCDADPKVEGKPIVVGNGEVTGHQHIVQCAERLNGDDLAWDLFADSGQWIERGVPRLAVPVDTVITHDEHNTLNVPTGVYEIIRQREYTPKRNTYVID